MKVKSSNGLLLDGREGDRQLTSPSGQAQLSGLTLLGGRGDDDEGVAVRPGSRRVRR